MKLKIQFLLFIILVSLPLGFARADEIGGLVLLPDGKPAQGAKVIARLLHYHYKEAGSTISVEEIATETDLLGFFDATVPEIPVTAGNRSMRPYLLIDAPGCALYFTILTDVKKIPGEARPIIQLQPEFAFTGIVLGPQGKPVSGAFLAIANWSFNGFESSLLNFKEQIKTPQARTKSANDGKFTLRGIARLNTEQDAAEFGSVLVKAVINGVTWSARPSLFNHLLPANEAKRKPLIIKLKPELQADKVQK